MHIAYVTPPEVVDGSKEGLEVGVRGFDGAGEAVCQMEGSLLTVDEYDE